MKNIKIPSNFIEAPIFADEYIFGSTQIQGDMLRTDGDWRQYIPRFEQQYKNGVESMSCTTYGTLNAIEILFEEKFGVPDDDYAERYTSTLAGTTKQGNNPHKVAETVRKYGLVEEILLPFDDTIHSWEDFYSPIDTRLKDKGRDWKKSWEFKHDWVITKDTPQHEKNERLSDALKFSPIGVSVQGWSEQNGIYIKTGQDNHWCTLLFGDRDYWYVMDSYPPYIKRLEKNYDFSFAKRYSLSHRPRNWILELFGI